MAFKPLVIDQGQIKQLPAGQSIDVGGWTLPSSGGSENQFLQADASGNAQWVDPPDTWDWPDPFGANMVLVSTGMGTVGWELKPFFYNANAPTADDQVFISNGASSAGWVTAGNHQILASDTDGELGFEDKPFGYKLASPTAQYQFLQATGSGSACWTLTPILGGNFDVATYKIYTSTTGGDIVIEPNGTGALRGSSGGNARGDYAVDWQLSRSGAADVASGNYSVVGGGEANVASATHTTVGGGSNNTATDNYATVSGGRDNDATGDYNTVGGGYGNDATGLYYSTIAGGHACQITGSWSSIGGGYSHSISHNYAAIAGGQSNTISEHFAAIPGGVQCWLRHWGALGHSAGRFEQNGDAQRQVLQVRTKTTSTSQAELFLDGTGGSEVMSPLYGHTWYYTIKILAVKKNATQNAYAETIEGILTRATGGTQHVAGPTVVRTLGTSLGTITVDDPDNWLRVQVTPSSSDEIWWLAVLDMVHINGYVA